MTSFVQFCTAVLALTGMAMTPVPHFYNLVWHERPEPVGSVWTWNRQEVANAPVKMDNDSLGVDVKAPTAIIIDEQSGATLWEKNPADVRSIGSISKLLSALVFLDHNPGWNTVYTITTVDQTNDGRQNFITGERVKVSDLLAASMIASDNDGVTALAHATRLSDEDFAKAMNDKARELGMTQSVFVEPTGLSAENVSTAREVIVLAKQAFSRPEIARLTGDKTYQFTSETGQIHQLKSTNKLFGSMLTVVEAKTGFIDQAGYCLVTRLMDKGRTIYTAVLGSPTDQDRFQDTKMLGVWAWRNFTWPQEAAPSKIVL